MKFETFDFATPSGSKRTLTDQGYLLIKDCVMAKAGVFDYLAGQFHPRAFTDRAATDIVRVYRSAQTIEEAAKGFSGAPVTDDHPPEMLDLKNTQTYQRGHINGEVSVRDGRMLADLIITDSQTVRNIQSGKDQLSNGYYSKYEFEAGLSPEGEAFDCEQVSFRANHVAIVLKGRNGAECRVSDAAESTKKEVQNMAIVTINGVSYEASEQVSQAVSGLQKNLDEAVKTITEFGNVDTQIEVAVKAKSDTLQATIDSQKLEMDELTKKIPSIETLDAMAAERAELLHIAKQLSPKLDFTGKNNDEVRSAVVIDCCADITEANKDSADYTRARFDAEANRLKTKDGKALTKALTDSLENTDSTVDAVAEARAKAITRKQAAWKKGV